MVLKSASVISSAVLHGTIVLVFLAPWTGGNALEMGEADDQFIAEQGISIEGVGFGTDLVTTEAVEETPMEMSAARPEIEEVVAEEPVEEQREDPLEALPEDTEVMTSQSEIAPALEAEPERTEEVVKQEDKPQEAQTATLEQQARVAVEEEVRSGVRQRGSRQRSSPIESYKASVAKKIKKKAKITSRIRLRGERLKLMLVVGKSGKILSVRITESSGRKKIDQLALKFVKRAGPFDDLPSEINLQKYSMELPLKFPDHRKKRRR